MSGECPWCSMKEDLGYPESRFTWEYVDTVRKFATEHGTVDRPHVVLLLEVLEMGARRRHGERP